MGSNERTVFKIKTKTGVRVKNFSEFGNNVDDYLQPVGVDVQSEDEVLILPGTQFRITAIKRYDGGVTEVQMEEVDKDSSQNVVSDDIIGVAVDEDTELQDKTLSRVNAFIAKLERDVDGVRSVVEMLNKEDEQKDPFASVIEIVNTASTSPAIVSPQAELVHGAKFAAEESNV